MQMLARGELHCIGATTLDEYRKNIEKDAALARRFQPVFVDEPSVEETISILRGLRRNTRSHHGVRITDSAIVAGAFMAMFPLARVIVVVPIVLIPLFFELHAFVFVGIWFLINLLQGTVDLLTSSGAGVAWWAHIGGFLAGLVLAPVLKRPERFYRSYYSDEGVLGFDPGGRR